MHALLASASTSPVFTQTSAPYLLLDDDLMIRAANDAYLRATQRDRDEILGMFIFDAFPDNPADPSATGVRNLNASLQTVLRRGTAHTMAIQRYDVAPTGSAIFVPKTWSPVNSPISDERGRPVGVLHHVEDVSPFESVLHAIASPRQGISSRAARELAREMRAATVAAIRYKHERDSLVQENLRLRDALIAMIASRGDTNGNQQAADARRRLWRLVTDHAADRRWPGWTGALCAAAVGALGTVSGAAVSIHTTAGLQELVAVTDEWTRHIEQLDYTLGEGPTSAAYVAGVPVHVADVLSERVRWPAYSVATADLGLVSASAFPLVFDGSNFGTLTVHRRHMRAPDRAEWIETAILADLAVSAVLADQERVERQLHTGAPLGYHDVAVAAGMLCVRQDISFDDAVNRLRGYAVAQDRAVPEVAADIISRKLRFD